MSECGLIRVSFKPLCNRECFFCYGDAAQKVVNRCYEGLESFFAPHPSEHLEAFPCSSYKQTGRNFYIVR